MKRILLAILLSLILIAGCNAQGVKQNNVSRTNKDVVTDSPKEEEQVEILEVYRNKTYKYSLDIPPHWKGKYKVIEEKNRSRFVYTGCPGLEEWIITVAVVTEEEFKKFNSDQPGITEEAILAKKDGLVYYYVTSIDVGFDMEQSKKYYEDYSKMYLSLGDIKRRFHL